MGKGNGTIEHFKLIKLCSSTQARLAELGTRHGIVPTPTFIPVASQGTVKTLTPQEIKDIGVTIILGNTYHLYLRPGIDIIEKLGGLHSYMGWEGPILTDSGGYQVFSLARLCHITDEGVLFRSHIDGSEHLFTPELAIEFQEKLGADIIMPLDECLPHTNNMSQIYEAMERTHRWAERCYKHHQCQDQLLFAIVQGGTSVHLRQQSAVTLASLDFPGYAIGGLSLGEPKELTWSVVDATTPFLPEGKPHYLMGVGSPEDIIEGVSRGIDLFDSALPTRVARNGALFTLEGRQNIRKPIYKTKDAPIDIDCECYTCRNFSAAYLHHLFKCEELLAYRLATIHNLQFVARLMQGIRDAIQHDTFPAFKKAFLSRYQVTNEEVRLAQKQKWLNSPRHHHDVII